MDAHGASIPAVRTAGGPRREEIKVVAGALFARKGYASTSMRDIAEASGLLAGSLYSHFRSKMDLVGEIVSAFYDELIPAQQRVLDQPGRGLDRLDLMITAVVEVCVRHRDELTILHYDWNVLSRLDELADQIRQSVETLELWRTVIDLGKADGSLDPAVDTDALTRVITSSAHALIDTVRYSNRPLASTAAADVGALLRHIVLRGVAIDQPAHARRPKTTKPRR